MTSSTYWSASPASAAVRTQPWTWSSRSEDRQRVDGRPQRGGLLEDVDAVLLALDHPRDAADLALHPRQAAHELGLVLRVAVAEVARVRRRRGTAAWRGWHRMVDLDVSAAPRRLRRIVPYSLGVSAGRAVAARRGGGRFG